MIEHKMELGLALVIMTIIIGLYLASIQTVPQTEAQEMILKPDDLGYGWSGKQTAAEENVANLTSMSYWDLRRQNSTPFTIDLSVWVYNQTGDCREQFESGSIMYGGFHNYTLVPIGDLGFYYEADQIVQNGTGCPRLWFLRGSILCTIMVYSAPGPCPWYEGVIFDIANLQLDKIDQYLAQHPGAS
jgi:hypothetical protein